MGFFGRFLVTTVAVIAAGYLLPGVELEKNYTPLIVALVLGLLNAFVKPLLVFFTIPFTILTFGLFLLVIDTVIIKMASGIVGGFHVESWWTAFFCGLIIAIITSLLEAVIKKAS